ncbi:MAG: hypothetical protein A2010_12865 [Nitrospirae bacterium GWD2_57_9]|nr:MAG: hypothetical protein A2010_12865 [Nitrospirae bacterium GWD2_57_9]OGW46606.1 MAG: hypothetical protein A2078_06875 [Nitrospirae bacterium GWC2_57_9]
MKIRRTIPPAAAPLPAAVLLHGAAGLLFPARALNRLTRELKEYFKVRHAFPVSSGKAALCVILRALKSLRPERDEVLIPAYTCFSVPSAIVKAGLRVALCDIDPFTFDFDQKLLPGAITERTLCVVPNHLFGIPADLQEIAKLCAAKGAFLVEDGAQAMGSSVRGRKLGTLGDAGFFSLGRGKNVTCGAGGVVVTGSAPIAAAIEREIDGLVFPGPGQAIAELVQAALLALFLRPSLYWFPAGLPALKLGETFFYRDFAINRLSGVQAGLLRGWQQRLDLSNRARRENADYFCRHLGIRQPRVQPRALLRLPVLSASAAEREGILAGSKEQGLGISSMYPAPVNRIEEIRDQFGSASFPAAQEAADRIVTLPTHPLLTRRDRQAIVRFFRKAVAPANSRSAAAISGPAGTQAGTL